MSSIHFNQLSILDFIESQSKTINIATMCSGIGTPEIALKELNINVKIIFACEIDDFARKTYLANHKVNENDFYKDITNFNAVKYIDSIDLLIFGSPCQPFSIAGYRKGFNDPRGKVFFDGIKRIDECKPEIVVFENVKGLTSQNKGEAYKIVKEEFLKIGYSIKFRIFNSFEHGSNQKRERLFIIAFKSENVAADFNIEDFEIKTNELYLEDYLLPIDEVEPKYWMSSEARLGMEKTVNDKKRIKKGLYLKERWEHCNINKSTKKEIYTITSSYSKGHPHNVLIDQRGCKYDFWTCDLAFTEFCESCDWDNGNCNYQLNNFPTPTCRKMTPRECARVQNIPDTFVFPVSDSQAWKQIGNSMDINTLKDLFKKLLLKIK